MLVYSCEVYSSYFIEIISYYYFYHYGHRYIVIVLYRY